MTQIPSDDILENLYKLRIRESEKLKTVLELYNMEIHQKKAGLDNHRLKIMVKRSIEQNLRMKNFEARNGNFETSAVIKNQRVKQREQRSLGDCWQWETNGQCSKGDSYSFRHGKDKRAKSTQPNPSPRSSTQQSVKNMHRETGVPEAEVQLGKWLDCRARIASKELTPSSSSTSPKMDANLEISALTHTARLTNSPARSPKRMVTELQWLYWRIHDNLDCVFQEMEPPKSSSILRKSSNMLKPIRCVQFTKAVLRHANIRDQKPSLGIFCPGDPHQRNPNAPKFGDRSQEETKRQERDAREAAWKMARCILKLKEKIKQHSSPFPENWCLPSPSTIFPEEREFVVDSGASMHMISKKDLSSAELKTVTTSRSPPTVMTANGEVQTHEETTVLSQRIGYILDNGTPRGYASSIVARKALRWT